MKKLTYLAGGTLFLLLAVYFGGKAFANGKIDDLIDVANRDGNQLSIGKRKLSFSILHAGLVLDSVRLDQQLGKRRISGTFGRIDLNGLSVFKAINGNISINDLVVEGPVLEVRPAEMTRDSSLDKDASSQRISVQDLRLVNGQVSYFDEAGDLKVKAIGLNSTTALNLPLAPATAPEMSVTADSLYFPASDDTDQSMNDFALDTKNGTLSIGTFRVTPRQTTRAFLTSIKYKRPWQALRLDGVTATDIPFDSLTAGGTVVLPSVNIGDLNFSIYENPSLERDPAEPRKNFPVESFRNLPRPLLLKSLTVDRANIAYGVHKEGAEKPDITFAGTIEAGNFSTWKQDEPAFIQMDCTFEKTSPLTVRFDLDQAGDGRDFTATGELKDYDLPNVNPLMVVAADADIEKGHIYEMTHDFSIRNGVSEGQLIFKYDHLEVKMTGKKAWLINLVEDIAIRDSNPRNDGELVIGTVYAEHEPTKSFFNIYWKSLVSGMTSSVAGKVFTPNELKPK